MNSFKREIVRFLAAESPLSEEEAAALVETPPDSTMGDYAVPCFTLARVLRKAPPAIAQDLQAAFEPGDRVIEATAVCP